MQVKSHGIISVTNESQRRFIDIVKGAAIFLMLYGHCIQYCVAGSEVDFFENGVFKVIYAFHMPLFMLISGYLFHFSFEKYAMKELLTRRVQAMLQPIVFCSMFSFLITNGVFAVARGDFAGLLDGGWLDKLPSLWFLWSVLGAVVAVTVVCKNVKSVFLQLPFLVLMTALVAFLPNATENIFMYPYFLIGFYFARYKEKFPVYVCKAKYLSLLLFPIMMCFYEKKHFIYITGLISADYSFADMCLIDGFRWVIGLVGAVFALTVLELLFRKGVLVGIVSLWLEKLGKKSLQIYALSLPLLSSLLSRGLPAVLQYLGIENIFVRNMIIYNFVFTLSLAVVYAVGLYLVVRLLEKAKISKILFGR